MIGTILTGCGAKDAAAKTPAENTQQTTPVQQEQSQTEKALALINTFATGDTDTARSLLADGYIQHNLAYGTGADAFVGSVEYLASADVKTTVNNIRAFEDGDKVFLQTIYNFAGVGEQVAFDIFRFDGDGKIAEHWDNLAALAEPNPSGHTQTDGTMEVTDLDKTEENRELVKNFLYDVMQGNNLDKTPDYFDGDAYIQHNSGIADGVSGLNAALDGKSVVLHQQPEGCLQRYAGEPQIFWRWRSPFPARTMRGFVSTARLCSRTTWLPRKCASRTPL